MGIDHDKRPYAPREQAEAKLKLEEITDPPTDDLQAVVHELRTHQVELEMQNEELRKTEKELTHAHEQYSNLYNFSPVGCLTISRKLIIDKANLTIASMLGRHVIQLLKSPFSKFVHEEDQDIYYSHHRDVITTGQQQIAELRLKRTDDSIFWARLETMVSQHQDETNKTLLMAISDISLQKEAEQKQEENVDKYRAVFESMVDVYYKTDLEGYLQMVSPSCLSITGYRPEEVIGRLVTDFYVDPVQRSELIWQLQQRGEVNDFEVQMVHKNGSNRVASISSMLMLDKEQQPVAIEGIVRDITARKNAEAKLKESQSNHAEAQKIAQLGHWTLDLIKGELLWSDENYRIFGQEPSASNTYETFLEIVHPDDYGFVKEAYSNSVKHRSVYDIEHRLLLPDGSIKWVHERCKTTYAKDGTPLSSIGTTLDITKRKQAEIKRDNLLRGNRNLTRELMQVQEEERRSLARDLHDELGQLLTSINARAEFIARHAEDNELCAVAKEIVRDVRVTFDASHAALLRLRPATLDALGLAAALTELADQWNKFAEIECTLQIDGKIDHLVELHSIAIYRLVQEGLTNALRHGKADRMQVIIKSVPPHEGGCAQVVVEITDNGRGLYVQTKSTGMGIIGMRERVYALGGTFLMTHMPQGGVRIEAMLPLDAEESA